MKSILSLIAIACVFCTAHADSTVWKGKVNSDGTPTPIIKLKIGEKYIIKVSGTINLGKWRTNRQPLNDDACFEFFADPQFQEGEPHKINTLKNSFNIDVCEGKYRPDHNYESKPFKASQNAIHFWIHDIDYEDNNGELDLEIVESKD